MKHSQKIVAVGAVSGVVSMILLVALFYVILPTPTVDIDVASRLVYALICNVFAVVPLFAMIASVGNSRFLSEAIDPLQHKESEKMIIDGRVVDNTLQQNFVFLIGTMVMASMLAPDHLQLLSAITVVFILARLAFWIGYRIDPLYRAPGMSATAYLNLGILLYVMYKVFFTL